ncbi:phosphoribosyltransferase [Sphaerisporangium sp. NPDC005289]|uniref:phosphoribosyltransferase n=1 Tax=Sphaerisporangium sp. NPDC005289 TaxID=3155247 RepID=UPI0033A21B8C
MCDQHLRFGQSWVADIVVPISYAVKRTQHAYGLAAYKAAVPSPEIQTNLLNLLLYFMVDHMGCVAEAARVTQWSHVAVVPSTKGRSGEHPLRALLGDRVGLPWVDLTVNPGISPDVRQFRKDWFKVPGEDVKGAHVLLLDDTWTTGSRVQSVSYALKAAGAARVAAIVLGRHANPEWDGWKPILAEIKDRPFRLDDCLIHER